MTEQDIRFLRVYAEHKENPIVRDGEDTLIREHLSEDQEQKSIFHKLINNDNDIPGILGYYLYKKDKINRIIESEVSQHNLSKNEKEAFQKTKCMSSNLENYKKKGTELFIKFLQNSFSLMPKSRSKVETELKLLSDQIDDLKKRNIKLTAKIKQMVENRRNIFLKSVLSSMVATIALSLIFIILWYSGLIPSLINIMTGNIK